MELRLIAASLLCVAMAGCASDDALGERRRHADGEFVTGSRIPQKDRSGVATVSPEEYERAAERASMPKKER